MRSCELSGQLRRRTKRPQRLPQVARQDRNLQPYHGHFYVVNAGLRKTLCAGRTVTKDSADGPIEIGDIHPLALDSTDGNDELTFHLPAMRRHRREMRMQQILLLVQWLGGSSPVRRRTVLLRTLPGGLRLPAGSPLGRLNHDRLFVLSKHLTQRVGDFTHRSQGLDRSQNPRHQVRS